MIYVIATLTIEKGSLPQIKAAVAPCLEATRKEVGCVSYDLLENIQNPESLVFVERWGKREHLTAHMTTPHLLAWRTAGGPFIKSRSIEIIHAGEVEKI